MQEKGRENVTRLDETRVDKVEEGAMKEMTLVGQGGPGRDREIEREVMSENGTGVKKEVLPR